jgi:antitoxin PrlF
MLVSKIFANGSTTLPKPVREALGLETGDTVRYVTSDKGVQVLGTRSVSELAGMLARDKQATVSLSKMENAVIKGAVERGK